VLAVLLIIGGGSYYFWSKYNKEKAQVADLAKQIEALKKEAAEKSASESETKSATKSAGESCATFTDEERAAMADWRTYTNDTYHYSFKYPAEWTISADDPTLATAKGSDSGEEITFQSRVGRATEIGFAEYTLTFTRDFSINCESASEKTYDGEDNLTMMAYTFSKSENPYLLLFSYKDIGASYSGNIYDIDKMILKTFTFSS